MENKEVQYDYYVELQDDIVKSDFFILNHDESKIVQSTVEAIEIPSKVSVKVGEEQIHFWVK